MAHYLDFEKPLAELEGKIREMKSLEGEAALALKDEMQRLEEKATGMLRTLYTDLDPWQKMQIARHPDRPHCLDYVEALIEDFTPLAGDRAYADDAAIISGLGRFAGQSVAVLGHEKGCDTSSRMHHNFGMARPEGYRKSVRLMSLAERFDLPVITFVDTAGAYPGVGAEERGQSEAIARSTDCALSLAVPNMSIVIGEGGSGGAIALAATNRVFMLEHAIYTVASPEACASILWRDPQKAEDAARAMKITAQELLKMRLIDQIVPEPLGGAHRNRSMMMKTLRGVIETALEEMGEMSAESLCLRRREKFLAMGRPVMHTQAVGHARRRRAAPRKRPRARAKTTR